MMMYSGDVTGDICNYARSAFIQKISQVTLKQFMDDFRQIASQVVEEDTGFYSTRGLKVHSLEVTGYRCADASTSAILQQMIKGELLKIQQAHQEEEARVAGRSDAERATQFLQSLEETVPDSQDRVAMWKVLRKGETLATLSTGKAHLYFTPSDVNLSIEDKGK